MSAYEKTKEAQEFENQVSIICYSRLSEFGFQADPFKPFKENLSAFGNWWAERLRHRCEHGEIHQSGWGSCLICSDRGIAKREN